MAKDPAFLFYPGDWQGGTSTFSRFLKGCYLDVLIAQFNSGHLSLEEIKTVLGSDFGQSWPTLQKKFKKDDDGLFFNEKLDTEIVKRKEYSKSRSENRKGKTHVKDMNNISNTYVSHMENENRNEIGFIKKNESFTKTELFNALFNDELYVTDLGNNFKGKSLHKAFQECWDHHSVKPSPPSELWEWKQKLNTWLINMKPDGHRNGTKTNIRRADATISTGEDFGKL